MPFSKKDFKIVFSQSSKVYVRNKIAIFKERFRKSQCRVLFGQFHSHYCHYHKQREAKKCKHIFVTSKHFKRPLWAVCPLVHLIPAEGPTAVEFLVSLIYIYKIFQS